MFTASPIADTTTTTNPTTAAPTLAPEPTYTVTANLQDETFTDDLNDPNSDKYKDLEARAIKTVSESSTAVASCK